MNLEIGDILLTRNEGGDEIENPTPGYYNHTAIYIGGGKIIEAQAHVRDGKWSSNKEDPGAVILADEEEFFKLMRILKFKDFFNKPEIRKKSKELSSQILAEQELEQKNALMQNCVHSF